MNRAVLAAVIAVVIAGSATTAASAADWKPPLGRWRGPCSTWLYGENLTPAVFRTAPDRAYREVRRLVVCVFDKYAPGNSSTALYVMGRESGGYPWAFNDGGCDGSGCIGLFQHVASAWNGRALAYLDRWMFGPNAWVPSGFDSRAQAIVSARMVAAGGWGPWGM